MAYGRGLNAVTRFVTANGRGLKTAARSRQDLLTLSAAPRARTHAYTSLLNALLCAVSNRQDTRHLKGTSLMLLREFDDIRGTQARQNNHITTSELRK